MCLSFTVYGALDLLRFDCCLHKKTVLAVNTCRYYSGHSDALGGILVVADKTVKEALLEDRTVLGSQPGALEAWLLIRSCRTLSLRVERQCDTATKLVCEFQRRICPFDEGCCERGEKRNTQCLTGRVVRQAPCGIACVTSVSDVTSPT